MILGRVLLILVAIISALVPVFSRTLRDAGWNALQATAARGLVGAVILAIVFHRKVSGVGRDPTRVIAVSLALMLAQTGYIYSSQHASIGVIVSLLYLGPIWVVCYERFFLKLNRSGDLLACILGFAGTLGIAMGLDLEKEGELKGVLTAFLVSLLFSYFIVNTKRLKAAVSSEAVAFYGCALTGAVFSWSLFSAPWTYDAALTALVFGLLNGGLYFLIYFIGLRLVPTSSEAGVWLYFEVLASWLIGVFYYHERVYVGAVAGALAIAGAGLLVALRKQK